MISLTVLSENTVRSAGLLGEHGLSYWLDTGSHRVLFDTGQGMALEHNATRLGIDLAGADAIVLSHGHYDHVSGLPHALKRSPGAALWFHPAATGKKFIREPDGTARCLSTGFMERGDFGGSRVVHRVTAPAEVVPGVWVTGEIPRTNTFEDVGGPFFLDESLLCPDPVLDDMALFLPGSDRCPVVLGCAHAGTINTLSHIAETCGVKAFGALIGGLHLASASSERLEETIAGLRKFAPCRMGFCHCTGVSANHRLRSEFPGAWCDIHAGIRLVLP